MAQAIRMVCRDCGRTYEIEFPADDEAFHDTAIDCPDCGSENTEAY